MANFTHITDPADIAFLMSTFEPLNPGDPWQVFGMAPVVLVTGGRNRELKFEIWVFDAVPSSEELQAIAVACNLLHVACYGRVHHDDFESLDDLIHERRIFEANLTGRISRENFNAPMIQGPA